MPVHVVGQEKSPGVKRGGTLQIVEHSVELLVPSDAIPDYIEASVDGLDIGSSVHLERHHAAERRQGDLDRERDPRHRRGSDRPEGRGCGPGCGAEGAAAGLTALIGRSSPSIGFDAPTARPERFL